jgi:hypothetical protein
MIIQVILIFIGFLLFFFIPAKFVKPGIIKKIFTILYFFFSTLFFALLSIFLDTGIPCDRETTALCFGLINGVLMFIYYHPIENIKLKKYWFLRGWLAIYLWAVIMLFSNLAGFGPLHQCYIDYPPNPVLPYRH